MTGQNYANHPHRARAWLITWLLSVVMVVFSIWSAVRTPSLESWVIVMLAFTALVTLTLLRGFALRLQNRIIRLEMQVRLARLGCEQRMERLELPQLMALRFASDTELPALMDRAIADKLSPDQIKRAVTDWQGDYLRT